MNFRCLLSASALPTRLIPRKETLLRMIRGQSSRQLTKYISGEEERLFYRASLKIRTEGAIL